MAEFLSQEWLDEQVSAGAGAGAGADADEPAGPVVSAVVQHVVNGAPDGAVLYWTRIDQGRVVEAALGEVAEPDLTFTVAYDDALGIDRGEVEPSAAYMQGRLKADGDMAKLLALLAATHRAPT